MMLDLAIIGAGPIGLEAAIQAKRAGLNYRVFDKGCIVNAIAQYPTYMTFFTTSERLEIGGHPLVSATDKPTRKEALDYYRKVVQNEGLLVSQYTEVTRLQRVGQDFELTTMAKRQSATVRAHKVMVATGYFDNPKRLGIDGEDLPHVSHYYSEAHPFYERNVTIVGAGSSAADAALDLYRGGARVTMIHRGADFRHSLKYWIRPNLENRVKEGAITAHFNTTVQLITPEAVIAEKQGETLTIPSDQVFLLTGYFANTQLFEDTGVEIHPDDFSVVLNPDTFETHVPGLYALGSAGFGTRTSDVFIENGLVQVAQAMRHLLSQADKAVLEYQP